jgi:hypothetical protein
LYALQAIVLGSFTSSAKAAVEKVNATAAAAAHNLVLIPIIVSLRKLDTDFFVF